MASGNVVAAGHAARLEASLFGVLAGFGGTTYDSVKGESGAAVSG